MELLKLEVNGKVIPLPKGQTVTFIEESPVFSTDSQGGDYSMSFNITETPEVNELFGYANSIEVVTPKKVKFSARTLISSGVWKSGTLLVKKFTGRYKAYFQSGLSSALTDVLDRPLNTLSFPDYSFADARAHAKTVALDPFNYDYVFFPVHAEDYSSNPLWSGVINQYDVTTASFIENSQYTERGEYEFETVLSPFPRISAVYKHIFSELGLTLDAPILDSNFVKRICFISSNSLSIEESVSTNFRISGKTEFNLSEFLPSMTVNDFLIEVNNLIGCVLDYYPTSGVFELKSRSTDILNDSKIYEFKGKLISASPILDGRQDLYFRFKEGFETFTPYTEEKLIDPDISIPSMTFASNQNAYKYGGTMISSYIPSYDLKMSSAALDIGSSDGDSGLLIAVYDGVTGASVSYTLRPYGYPQAHGRKVSDLLDRFNHFVGTLEWEGVSDIDDPGGDKAQNGLYYSYWEEWTEFERSAKQVELIIVPTAEDIVNSSGYNKVRIENYTVLIKSKESQINGDTSRINVVGYLI